MFKQSCAILLLVVLFFHSSVLAAEDWIFGTPANTVNSNSIQNPYDSENIYTPYISHEDNIYVNVEDNEDSYSGYVYTDTANKVTDKTTNKKEGTFSENHPVLTTVGYGALLLGLSTGLFILSAGDDDKQNHNHRYHDRDNRHSSYHHHSNNYSYR